MGNDDGLTVFLEENPTWGDYMDLIMAPPTADELKAEHPDVGAELVERCGEVMQGGFTRGAFYWKLRSSGKGSNMAEMLALQRGPGLDTDDVFFSGQKPLYDQFESQKHLDKFLARSRAMGHKPSVNSTYYPNLARFPGDPEAFVSRSQGRSYIKKLCETRGWACEGGVNVKHRQPEVDPMESRIKLGEDIVRESMADEQRKNPGMSKKQRKELREKVIAKHSYK